MMYYGLRGVEAHNNRTKPTVTSEDNSTILIIILMIIADLHQLVICAKLLQDIDEVCYYKFHILKD